MGGGGDRNSYSSSEEEDGDAVRARSIGFLIFDVEAAQAVYGDDCLVIETYLPHLHVHLKPRTADVSSEQFVEATIGMQAGPKYLEEPPVIRIIDSKGLDE